MADFKTMGYADTGGDHPPPEASEPSQNQGPTVTRNEEGKTTLRLGPSAVEVAQPPSDAPPTTSQPVDSGQPPQPSQTLSTLNTDLSAPSTMARNTTDTEIIHEVHNAESNTTTITVRGGRSASRKARAALVSR
ncbi:hypothetical protein NA56DRAFT_703924 [Hyaloscypha hepaticicola]|uniref:Uncharacterized protein n=1 Tax=Hyaloscypha hepaticicola TaxID=2082293 RepID=A0A2J6Q4M7_9HELO|nr:hypothetical protein NA56DRAFT_703924 [Hyaloscypha hepaticicola]